MSTDTIWFSDQTVFELFMMGMIVDGRAGGLILGKPNDGIYLLQEAEEGKFIVPPCVEGGEYLINHFAYQAYKDRIEKINSENNPEPEHLNILTTNHTRVINTFATPDDLK